MIIAPCTTRNATRAALDCPCGGAAVAADLFFGLHDELGYVVSDGEWKEPVEVDILDSGAWRLVMEPSIIVGREWKTTG